MNKRLHNPEKCPSKQFHWLLSPANEDGWMCSGCALPIPGEPPGYSPELDRSDTYAKVESIAQHLQMEEIVYFSNSSEAHYAFAEVAKECHELKLFDQVSIVALLCKKARHALYWKELGESIMTGKDPRRRCRCGQLANTFSGEDAWCSAECQRRDQAQGKLPFEA